MLTLFEEAGPGLTIKVPVKVMAVVTETLRQELAKECQDNLRKLEYELEQLAVQLRRLQKEHSRSESGEHHEAEKRLEEETQDRQNQRVQWRQRIREIAQLSEGALLLQGTAEALVRVEAGMKWDDLDSGRIIVKDGIIVEAGMGSLREEEPCNG